MPLCPTCRTQCEEGIPICPVDGTALAPHDMTGRVFGERYRVLERIGAGGMGTVYLCEHVALGRKMAVKVLRPEFCADEELVRRFQQEAQAASLIGQENIVDVIDFGRASDGSLYFVMEALDGESLASLLRRERRLPPHRALPILSQICRALGAAHARGVVHRDLKPENVFLLRREDGSDFVKVFDFGISKHGAAPESLRLTRAGSIIGTPEYMAPEQAAATTVDHRCDIYAFGVLAYEMLTGTLPFQGDTALATLIKHQSEPPDPPSRRNPDLPPEVEHFILKALVKRPQGRQQNMAEVAEDLSRALLAVGLGPVHTPAPGARLSPPTARFDFAATARSSQRQSGRGETMALDSSEVDEEQARGKRWRRMALVAALSLVVGVATGLGWRWSSRGGSAAVEKPSAVQVATVAPAQGSASAASEISVPGPAGAPAPQPLAAPERPSLGVQLAAVVPETSAPPPSKPPRLERRRAALRPVPKPTVAGGRSAAKEDENPYGKVDDLKPDPFR